MHWQLLECNAESYIALLIRDGLGTIEKPGNGNHCVFFQMMGFKFQYSIIMKYLRNRNLRELRYVFNNKLKKNSQSLFNQKASLTSCMIIYNFSGRDLAGLCNCIL